MATSVEEAEKAYRLAEERFLAGNVAGALRVAWKARRLSSLLPALASALPAYEVHAAAAAGGGKNWYAVLGLAGQPATAITHNAVRARYLRLCLVLHPDKNRSAAADGAFKLLQQAWEALSAIHPPPPAAAAAAAQQPRPTYTAPPPQEPPADDSEPPPPPSHKPRPAPARTSFNNFGKSEPPEPVRTSIYCWHCDSEFVAEGVIHDKSGVRCHKCGVRLRPPWRSRPAAAPAQQPPPEDRFFPCPGQCPRCATRFSSLVSVGTWHLRCKACSNQAMVKVHSRYTATT
ncbi:hypothetical protein ACP4OV_008514 [Aristida adscensionis]